MNFFAALDAYALTALPLSDTSFVLSAFLSLTQLGDARFVIIAGLSIALVLWRYGHHDYWMALGVSVVGASATAWVLKLLIARPRPVDALIDVTGYSLPSGHAATSFALYGFVAYALYKLISPSHHRTPLLIVMLSLAVLVSVSRLYLGVHYATDVLAGTVLGALWAYASILLRPYFAKLTRRR